MSVNKVILVGNVGKDPETRYLDEGTAISKFPLATSETYRNRDGERVSTTEWHNVVLWRGLAQVAEKYVKKGTQLYIEGRIKTRSYDDSEGNKKYITEIVGDQMQMLGRRPDDESEQGMESGRATPQQTAPSRPDNRDTNQTSGQGETRSADPGEPSPDSRDPNQSDEQDPFGAADEGPDDLPF
jgi:single-strand DNA-binding protein